MKPERALEKRRCPGGANLAFHRLSVSPTNKFYRLQCYP